MHANPPPGPPTHRSRPGHPPSERSADDVSRLIAPGQRRIAEHQEKLVSMVAHGSGIVTTVIGPAIIWYLYQERSDYVRYHAYQAMIWQAGVLVGGTLITVITCGAGSVVFLLAGLMSGFVALRAWEGDWKGYPLMDDLGR